MSNTTSIIRNKRRISPTVLSMGAVILFIATMMAGHATPALGDSSPPLPRIFNRPVVQKLIDEVDHDNNAVILKMTYFASRGTSGLPGEEGLQLLKAALEKESEGSPRWLTIQALYGYGALRLNSNSFEAGLNAYLALFSKVTLLGKSENLSFTAQNTARTAICDFVALSTTIYIRDKDKDRINQVLRLSLQAWIAIPNNANGALVMPHWAEAIAIYGDASLQSELTSALAAPASLSRPLLLLTSAQVFKIGNPQRALQYLDELDNAQSTAPRADDDPIKRASANLRLEIDTQMANWPDAISVQRRLIGADGKGVGYLISLFVQSGQMHEVPKVLDDLNNRINAGDQIDADEICLIGEILLLRCARTTRESNVDIPCLSLLKNYVVRHPSLNMNTLHVRVVIAQFLLSAPHVIKSDLLDAEMYLAVPGNTAPATDVGAQIELASIKKLTTKTQGMKKKLFPEMVALDNELPND